MQSLDADDLESLKSQLIDGVTKLYERACICRQKSNECSKAREFPLQSFPDTNYKQMEKLQQRDKRLRTENEKLKHVVQVYNNRRRSDQESVKRWMAYAKELEKVNQQLMTDVKVLQRQSISGVEPANIFDNGQIGTHSSQIPTDSTCDEEGILQDEIKQEPVDKVEIKKEPNSSPDFSTPTANKVVDDRTNASSQLPAHLVPDSLDLEAPVFSRTHLNDDKLSCIAQVASSRDCHSVLHSDSDNGGGCHPGYELHTELQSDSDNGAHSHTGADGLSVTVSSMTNGLTPKSLKRPAKPNFHEIDQDLRSGKRRVMFESPNVQLPTPKTLGAQRRITDSWLNKDIINKASFSSRLNDDTPIKHKLDSQPIKNIDFKSTDKNTFISRQQSWHPSDFIINSEFNDNLSYAFKETLRGDLKQCEHGYNCSDCSKFYEAAGPGFAPATPQWNSQNKPYLSSTNKGSRHRDRWERRPSPPGFWRSDFPNTQETEDEKRALEQYRNKEAEKRFEQAIVSGKYLFRDQNIRHHLTKL